MSTPYDLGWGDPRRGGFTVVAYDIGEGVRLAVRNDDVGAVFAELVRRLMAAGWDGPADPIRDDWGYNPRLKRWAEAEGLTKATAALSAWSDHAWATAIDLDTAVNPMLARRPADPWSHTNMPRSTSAIARGLGIEWGGDWSEPWDPQHFQIVMTPQQTADMAARIRSQEEDDDMSPELISRLDAQDKVLAATARTVGATASRVINMERRQLVWRARDEARDTAEVARDADEAGAVAGLGQEIDALQAAVAALHPTTPEV